MFLLVGPLAKLKKDSAKLGRFKETEKLLSNDKNFYRYTDEDIANIKKSHNKKFKKPNKWEIIKNDFKFILGLKNDYKEYLNYKNTKQKEELKLAEILRTMPVSKEQLADAKKLQQQTFMAFEKIDDKSECLVDDTTAAVDTMYSLIAGTVCSLANIVTLKLFGNKISQFTKNKTMPRFFEGLKLTKHLSLKNMVAIFIVPFLVTRGIIILTSLIGIEIKKKSCKIGIMSATKELDNPKNFLAYKAGV